MRISESMRQLTGWKAVVAAIFIVGTVGLRVATRMNRQQQQRELQEPARAQAPVSQQVTPTQANFDEGTEEFTIEGIATITVPPGFEWKVHEEWEHEGKKYATHLGSNEAMATAISFGYAQQWPNDEARRQFVNEYYDQVKRELASKGNSGITGERPVLDSPLPNRVGFSMTMTGAAGEAVELRCLVIFGKYTYAYEVVSLNSKLADRLLDIAGNVTEAGSLFPLPDVKNLAADAPNLVNTMAWSGDAMHLFTLSKQGLLQKFSLPELHETARIQLDLPKTGAVQTDGECWYVGRSRQGLVVATRRPNQILLVNEESLETQLKVDVDNISSVACSSATSIVYAGEWNDLHAIDLRDGKTHKMDVEMALVGDAAQRRDFRKMTMSADGKTLFTGVNQIHRVELRGSKALVTDVSERISGGARGVHIDEDARLVAMPGEDGNRAIEGYPEVVKGTYIYSTADLQKPQFAVNTGSYPRVVAFDPATKNIYAQNDYQQLIVLSEGGEDLYQQTMGDGRGQGRCFLVHPHGHRLAVLTDDELFWVELASAKAVALQPRSVPFADTSEPPFQIAQAENMDSDPDAGTSAVPVASADPAPSNSTSTPPKAEVAAKPEVPAKPAVAVTSDPNLKVKKLGADARNLVSNMVWSGDAMHLFTLSKQGLLQKFSLPGLQETQRTQLDLPKTGAVQTDGECFFLGRSRQGLVVATRRPNQIWSLDEASLQVKRKIDGEQLWSVACSSASSIVYASTSSKLYAADLRNGKIDEVEIEIGLVNEAGRQGRDFRLMKMSPDGKTLFAGINELHRVELRGKKAIVKDVSESISGGASGIYIDEAAQLVAMPGRAGNRAIEGYPKVVNGTYVYSAVDLQMPKFAINAGGAAQVVAFDPASKNVYTQHYDKQLIVLSEGGEVLHEHTLGAGRCQGRCFLVHPGGYRLAVLTSDDLFWVELTGAGAVALKPRAVPFAGSPEPSEQMNRSVASNDAAAKATPAVDSTAPKTAKSSLPPGFRKWTDKTGKFTVVAKFISLNGDVVVLEKQDGKQAKVPLSRLGDFDQRRARALAKQQ